MISISYLCPRCNVDALPAEHTYPFGWCPICGMDPDHEGPAKPMRPTGILHTDIAALRRKFRQHPDQRPHTTDDEWEHPAGHWEGGGE